MYGRCHLNASAVIKSLDGPTFKIIILRRSSALSEMAVKPLTQFPVHLEEETNLEAKYTQQFTGRFTLRTVTVRKGRDGLGIMIIEARHADLGRGIFISDIQSNSPAEQSGLAVGDMILCVDQTDLIRADYETVSLYFVYIYILPYCFLPFTFTRYALVYIFGHLCCVVCASVSF